MYIRPLNIIGSSLFLFVVFCCLFVVVFLPGEDENVMDVQ